ncbi:TPA: hypothetical protein L4W91_002385 [Pseudomonas aeruginosa]|nr:hypothetical protein [Pseudomonas aeruginosa]
MVADENGELLLPDAGWRRLSDRYCEHHDPGDPYSRYRADLPFKQAFQREVEALEGVARSGFEFRFQLPNGADAQELRKTAYDQVHARLRPCSSATENSAEPGLRERVWLLHREGLHQAEIARRLGVSRQAVSKAWKSLGELVKTRQAETYVDPISGEPAVRPALVAQLKELQAQGATVAEMARRTRLFKHTVRAIIRDFE